MFGFPTKVRYLFHGEPRGTYPWPPLRTIDRELEIAVAQFAPGAEVVKDKAIHVGVGVAAWEPIGRDATPVSDPLGPTTTIDYCRQCLFLRPVADGDPEAAACPACSRPDPDFRRIVLAEPLGFRSDWAPKDYDGQFEWYPGTGAARISPQDPESTPTVENLDARVGRGQLFVVNATAGIYSGSRQQPIRTHTPVLSTRTYSQIRCIKISGSLTLCARNRRARLLLGRRTSPTPFWPRSDPCQELMLDPRDVGARAILYSAGFLLREAAARRLDVQSRELRLGLWAQPLDAYSARGWLFLADALENGAGYCTFLGQADELRALLREGEAYVVEDLEEEAHASKCDASCYDCLREYGNQAYHGLLDWRLARDWLDLALGRPLNLERWADGERAVAESFCTAFAGESWNSRAASQPYGASSLDASSS